LFVVVLAIATVPDNVSKFGEPVFNKRTTTVVVPVDLLQHHLKAINEALNYEFEYHPLQRQNRATEFCQSQEVTDC
jgi:hypothetical protein